MTSDSPLVASLRRLKSYTAFLELVMEEGWVVAARRMDGVAPEMISSSVIEQLDEYLDDYSYEVQGLLTEWLLRGIQTEADKVRKFHNGD